MAETFRQSILTTALAIIALPNISAGNELPLSRIAFVARDVMVHNCSAWWFGFCSEEALNGKYVPPNWGPEGYGFGWYVGYTWIYPQRSRMMVRKVLQ